MKELTLAEITAVSMYRPGPEATVAEVTAKRDAFWEMYQTVRYGQMRVTFENAIERLNEWLAEAAAEMSASPR